MIKKLINIDKLNVFLEGNHILQNIDLSIKEGEITTIVGPNGSGKTTLVRTLLGFIKPYSGTIKLKENLRIGYMPQKIHIDKILPLSCYDFLKLTYKPRVVIEDIIKELNLESIINKQVYQLSGGYLQRLLLAKSLLNLPELLVLDEPLQGVDVAGQVEFYGLIETLKKKYNMSILIISHDLYMVMKTTDHVFCLNKHICCEGGPEDVSKHPAYLDLFGANIGDALAVYSHHHDHTHKE